MTASAGRPERRIFTGADGNHLMADDFGHSDRGTVLLLHGGGQTRHAWRGAGVALARQGFRAIALDQRGHGESDWVEAKHYGFPDYAADAALVARQIAAETGRRPISVGASMGGIASLYAQGREPVFGALVLVDVAPRIKPDGVEKIQGFMRLHAEEGFASLEEAAEAVAAYLPHRPRPKSLEGLRKNLRLKPDGRLYWHWDPAFLDGARNVNTDWEGVSATLEESARALAVPALLVRGGSSELVGEEEVKSFLALCPHARYADVAGARHMVAGDKNDAFLGAVAAFLDEVAPT